MFLDRRADVTKGAAGFDRRDPHHQRLMGYLDQPLGLAGQLAGHKHPAGVAIPTVDNNGHVDIQDVASLQLFLLAGYAVTDDMIDRDTASMLITLITDGGTGRARHLDLVADQIIQPPGALPDKDMFVDLVKDARGQLSGPVHTGEIIRLVDANAVFGQPSPVSIVQG